MKLVICIGAFALAAFSTNAIASESCDQAFTAMKKFESEKREEIQASLDVAFAGLNTSDICNAKYLEAQDRIDAYYMRLAVFAKAFVAACKGDPARANDVFLYSLPEIQSSVPSSVRQICENLRK